MEHVAGKVATGGACNASQLLLLLLPSCGAHAGDQDRQRGRPEGASGGHPGQHLLRERSARALGRARPHLGPGGRGPPPGLSLPPGLHSCKVSVKLAVKLSCSVRPCASLSVFADAACIHEIQPLPCQQLAVHVCVFAVVMNLLEKAACRACQPPAEMSTI